MRAGAVLLLMCVAFLLAACSPGRSPAPPTRDNVNAQNRPTTAERPPVQVGITHDAPLATSVVLARRSAEAIRMGRRGPVIAEIRVDETGVVSFGHILRGDPLLNDAARQAVEQWRYAPPMFKGRPTAVVISVVIDFTDH